MIFFDYYLIHIYYKEKKSKFFFVMIIESLCSYYKTIANLSFNELLKLAGSIANEKYFSKPY